MTEGPRGIDRVRPLREALTATGAGLYLATHLAGPIPAEAMAAAHESDELELRIGRAGPDRADDLEQRDREARAVVAAVLKASPERVVLAHGSAEAARAIALELLAETAAGPGRVLVVGGLDASVVAAVESVAAVAGLPVDTVAELPSSVPGDALLVLVAHVDLDGRLAPVPAIAAAAHAAGARLIVDVGRSVGAVPFDVDDLRADAVIGDTHRWLLGPDGLALAWLAPSLGPALPARLRAATAPFGRAALLSLARSVGWLLMYVELPWAITRAGELADLMYDELAAIRGVELRAAPDAHGALAAFRIAGWDAEVAAEELSRSVFAILEADAGADLLRASVGAWNRESEIERFAARVADLAAHTPETLPRKPSLTIIHGPIEPDG